MYNSDIIEMIGGRYEYDYTGGKVETNFDTLKESLLDESDLKKKKDDKNNSSDNISNNNSEDDSEDDSYDIVGKYENPIESTELSDEETGNYVDYLDRLNIIMDKYK